MSSFDDWSIIEDLSVSQSTGGETRALFQLLRPGTQPLLHASRNSFSADLRAQYTARFENIKELVLGAITEIHISSDV